MNLLWYLRRLASMDSAEISNRVVDRCRQEQWKRRQPALPLQVATTAQISLVADSPLDVSPEARASIIAAAEELLEGRWTQFGRKRTDLTSYVDYHKDPLTGRRSPSETFFARLNHRDESLTGNVKFVWEIARHHHLTLLGAAFALSGDHRFAERATSELHHFIATNPFPLGVHWTSGIEIGMRLQAWSLLRLLLHGYEPASACFEHSADFVGSLGRHQQWLDTFGSHGTSANNHLIAELAGQYCASAVFPFFSASDKWRSDSIEALTEAFDHQTLPDGHNCELATSYHLFVQELMMFPTALAIRLGEANTERLVNTTARSIDALASMLGAELALPRFGDSDDAFGLLIDPPETAGRIPDLLEFGSVISGPAEWWPTAEPRWSRTRVLAQLFALGQASPRKSVRRETLPDAGFTILRAERTEVPATLFFDHGPLGYLATAAHGHADALSVQFFVDGVEVLADPGTYCYHGEPAWRNYFRSTRAHNTVVLGGEDQSMMRGPFLWSHHASADLLSFERRPTESQASAIHRGYRDRFGLDHTRTVTLSSDGSGLVIQDGFDGHGGDTSVEVNFHLGPSVRVDQNSANEFRLKWDSMTSAWAATLTLDNELAVSWERGRDVPEPIGWYSDTFGTKTMTPTITASGRTSIMKTLVTTMKVERISSPAKERQ